MLAGAIKQKSTYFEFYSGRKVIPKILFTHKSLGGYILPNQNEIAEHLGISLKSVSVQMSNIRLDYSLSPWIILYLPTLITYEALHHSIPQPMAR